MTAVLLGRSEWSMTRDEEGHREYTLVSKVGTNSALDGPATVLNAAGLPTVGSYWFFGTDVDVWAFCWPTATVSPMVTDEPGYYWRVTQKFSTKPFKRCQDASIDDPLLEPPKISGSFNSRERMTTQDIEGSLIKSSSHELIALPYDISDHIVVIDMNVASLDLGTWVTYNNAINDAELWGVDPYKIRLTNPSWTRNVYGTCSYYITVHYEFAIRDSGWDESEIADAGKRCLRGDWSETKPPVWIQADSRDPGDPKYMLLDSDNPDHFEVAKDPNGEPYGDKILLDGSGGRLTNPSTPVFLDPPVMLYHAKNFLELGIPTDITVA